MNSTKPLQKLHRPMQPYKWWFYEDIALCGKNAIIQGQMNPQRSACAEEMQRLFQCLKKWEFDDLPCVPQRDAYNACVANDRKRYDALKKAQLEAPIGTEESMQQRSLSQAQMNKLMAQWPQPDLGKWPFRLRKRLPSQPYYEDQFNAKNKRGIPS